MSTEYDPPQPPSAQPAPQGYAQQQSYGQPQAYAQPQPYGQPQGYAAPAPYGYAVAPQAPSNGIGTAGFVCGLVGLVLCWVPWFGAILGLVGVVLSAVGISQGKKKGAPTGLAIGGLVCGILAVLVWVVLVIAVFSVASSINTY